MRVWFSILMVALLLVSFSGGAVAADLISLSLSLPNVTGGAGVTGTVTVSSVSQSKTTIQLKSSNPTVATVPGSVTVAPGAVTATFPVTTKPVGQTSTVTISGKLGGKTTAATLAVTPIVPITIAPTSVILNASSVAGGAIVTGHVTLSGPAPMGGLAVGLASSNPTAATVPAGVTVAPGASTATFPVTTKPVGQSTAVTIAASAHGVTTSAPLTVVVLSKPVGRVPELTPRQQEVKPSLEVVAVYFNPPYVKAGATATAQVTLSGSAPPGGLVVGLSSSNPTVATVPASVTVGQGASATGFLVTAKPVGQSTTVTIAVSAGGVTKKTDLLVLPPVTPTSLTFDQPNPIGGTTVTGQVTLSGPAPSGGLEVSLWSDKEWAAPVPSRVMVAAGASSVSFQFTTRRVGGFTWAKISASYGGVPTWADLYLHAQQ